MTKILPLPVKKNKFGERVADISLEKYYHQICEEVLEAHEWQYTVDENREHSYEAEEIVDVITCCITRLNVMHWYEDYEDFGKYVVSVIHECKSYYEEPKDFYTDLSAAVMNSYHAAKTAKNFEYMRNEGCGYCVSDLALDEYVEKYCLGYIIVMCIKRLEKLGYDESERQEIYQAVNAKNRKRGYFEE